MTPEEDIAALGVEFRVEMNRITAS